MTPRLGRFSLVAPLARGASGIVYRGRDDDGNDVAVKLLGEVDPKMSRLFEQEIRTAMALDHPCIVPILETGRCPEAMPGTTWVPGSPWLAMPYCSGGTVAHHPPSDWPALRQLLQQLLEALAHAHARGILHRDVKAANLLLNARGDVLLGDFGLSRSLADTLQRPLRGGTPGYVAPEQGQGRWWQEGPHTDLYAVGVLAWRLAAGELPELDDVDDDAQTDPLRRRRGPLPVPTQPLFRTPSGFLAWCRRMAAPEPSNRFDLAADALAALAQLDGSTVRTTISASTSGPIRGAAPSDLRLPLVGRHPERERLQRLLAEARAGRTRTVILSGPVGYGTTTLAQWISELAHEGGQAWPVQIRHDAHGRSPRFGIEGALRHALGLVRARPQEASGRGVSPEQADLVWPRKPLAGPERRRRIQQALRGSARPTLLWVDDAHWGLEAVRLATSWHASDDPALIILTIDPTALSPEVAAALEELSQLDGVEALALGRLSDAEMCELLDGVAPLAPGTRTALVRHMGGHPLYAVQWTQDALDRGHLLEGADGFALDDPHRLDDAPDLTTLWGRRLAAPMSSLSKTERASIALAAVLGVEVDRSLWRDACAAAGLQPSDEGLVQLQRAGLLHTDPQGIRFVHPILREALVAPLSRVQRLAFAQAGAAALKPLGIETAERRATLLHEAGHDRAAYDVLAEAVQHWGFVDFERVVPAIAQWQALCDSTLAPDDPRALGPIAARARLAWLMEDRDGLLVEHGHLATIAETYGSRVAWMHAGRTAHRAAHLIDDLDACVGHLQRALEACDEPDYEDTIRTELCDVLVRLGELERAYAMVADAPRSPDPHDCAHYLIVRANTLTDLGRAREALLQVEAIRDDVEALDNRVQHAQWHLCRAEALLELGMVEPALEAVRHGIEVRRLAGLPALESRGLAAGMLLQLGRTDEVLAELRELPDTPLTTALRLAVWATQGDLESVRAPLLALTTSLPGLPYVPRTLVRALERIGDDASAQGSVPLAALAWSAAARGWRRLGSMRRAQRVRTKLGG